MSIATWGWGACAGPITSWGWGPDVCAVPYIIADALSDSGAYSCVVKRTYIEIRTRDRGDVVLRVRPDQLSERVRGEILERARGDVSVRSAGWPNQTGELCDY